MSAVAVGTLPVTERSALELAAAIRARELTAREVVDAHIAADRGAQPARSTRSSRPASTRRAPRPTPPTRCVAAADAGDELPPLLGVPCTIKESFALAGMPNTSGSLGTRATSSPSARRPPSSAWSTPARSRSGSPTPPSSPSGSSPRTGLGPDRQRLRPRPGPPAARRAARAPPSARASRRSASAPTSAARSGCRRSSTASSATSRRGGLVPHTGHYPYPNERGSALLGTGPLTRRAEDLMPFLRHRRGPGRSRRGRARDVELGDPAEVSIEGLRVVISDDATMIPVALELRNARDPRGAGAARRRRRGGQRVSLPAVKTRDPAVPQRDARVGRAARAADRGRRRAARASAGWSPTRCAAAAPTRRRC